LTILKKKVLFIGAGRMAQAIIAGLKDKVEFDVLVTNSGDRERLDFVRDTYSVETTMDWKSKVHAVDIIILAIPPEAHERELKALASLIERQLIITVAAGISPTYLESMLPEETPVAWIMPNTAAKIGMSMTLYSPGKHVDFEHIEWIQSLICGIGEFELVSEQQIFDLTAITGSAPAFIYRVAEALEEITLMSGVSKEQARKLVAQMIAGSAEMLKTNVSTEELVNEVATPGGSTASGLKVLEEKQLDQMIKQAIQACREKVQGETKPRTLVSTIK
jgi:pyrroline-5-carboxylate reductase